MFTAAVLTVSDSAFNKTREDTSGGEVERVLKEGGFTVVQKEVVPDDIKKISKAIKKFCKQGVNLVATTGGTGFSLRDVTPEATALVSDRLVPGIAEAMRANSVQYTPKAMLSRGICAIKDKTVILNLPGSPKACVENLSYVIEPLKHGIDILLGNAKECARK